MKWKELIVLCILVFGPGSVHFASNFLPSGQSNPVPLQINSERFILSNSSCDTLVDAGPDVSICSPGGSVQLNGSVENSITSFYWTPSGPLDDPNILNPSAFVNKTTSFILHGTGLGPNLIVNGDFELGNFGFSSDYTYNPGSLVPEGTYAVVDNPNSVHPGFQSCADHTPAPGNNMMVINGAVMPDMNIWCQTVNNITPNTDYELSTWVTSVIASSPAQLQFFINGQQIGSTFSAPSSTTCNWIQFAETWNSGAVTSATICIVNQNTAGGGNDFAIDDIALREICNVQDTVIVEVLDPKEETLDTAICAGGSLNYNGYFFDQEGSHMVTLQTNEGCDSIVTLNLEVLDPEAFIAKPDSLTCTINSIDLDGTASSGDNLIYEWNTVDGHFVGNPIGPFVTVDQSGTYTLRVWSQKYGVTCPSDFYEVNVIADTIGPVISIDEADTLGCTQDTVTLNGHIDYASGNTSILWSTQDGRIIDGFTSLNPRVDKAGTYLFTVTQDQNGCSSIAYVQVYENLNTSTARITQLDSLDCLQDTIGLDGSASSPEDVQFQWYSSDGNIVSDSTQAQIQISKSGSYHLVVSKDNECADSTSIVISRDTVPPEILLRGADTLTCKKSRDSILINNYRSLEGTIVEWVNVNDSSGIIDNRDSMLIIEDPGWYKVKVQSLQNGCVNFDSAFVASHLDSPSISFSQPDSLSCADTTVEILVSTVDTLLNYQWSTKNGDMANGPDHDTLLAKYSAWYYLELTNIQNGCSSNDSIFIPESKENVSFTLRAASDTLNCAISQIQLQLEGIHKRSHLLIRAYGPDSNKIFQNNDTTEIIDKAGLYTAIVQDTLTGCQNMQSIQIWEDLRSPEAYAGPDDSLNCKQPYVKLDGSNSTGSALEYEWFPIDEPSNILGTGPLLNVNTAGRYILKVTNSISQCYDLDTVKVYSNPDIPRIEIDSARDLTCKDSVVLLDANGSEQGPLFKAFWIAGDGEIIGDSSTYSVEVDKAGTYVFHLLNERNGCIAIDSLQVQLDTSIAGFKVPSSDSLTCAQNVVELYALPDSAGNYSYSWKTDANGNIIGSSSGQEIVVNAAAMYFVTVIDESNACSREYDVAVVKDTLAPMAEAGPDQILPCSPMKLQLSAAPISSTDVNYLWEKLNGGPIEESDTADITIQSPGLYVLNIKNLRNGCTGRDTIQINRAPIPNINYATADEYCNAGGWFVLKDTEDSLTASIPSIGTINIGDTIQNLTAGTYQLIVTNEYGCRTDSSVQIQSIDGFEINLPNRLSIEAGEEISLQAELSIPDSQLSNIQWVPPTGLSCDDCLNPSLILDEDREYQLIVTDKNACTATANIKINVVHNLPVYIPNAFSPNGDGINDEFTVYGADHIQEIEAFEIYNRWGECLYIARNIPPGSDQAAWDGTFNGKDLNSSVFVYKIALILKNGSKKLFAGNVSVLR